MILKILLMIALIGPAETALALSDEPPQQESAPLTKAFLYTWTDAQGVVHIADDPDKVPRKYRDKAVRSEQREPDAADAMPNVQEQAPPPSGGQDAEEDRKAEWQYRMKIARNRLAQLEVRYRELDARLADLHYKIMYMRVPGNIIGDANEAEAEMKKVEKEIQETKHEINVAIPEEARKAGIPPGWIRD